MPKLIDPIERLEDRVRTMRLVRRNPVAVEKLYVTGIKLCNTEAESGAEAFGLRVLFRAMVAERVERGYWPKTMQQFFSTGN